MAPKRSLDLSEACFDCNRRNAHWVTNILLMGRPAARRRAGLHSGSPHWSASQSSSRAFGFNVSPDTLGYLNGDTIRSRPYPVMTWLADAVAHPLNLVWLQIALGAIASRSSRLCGRSPEPLARRADWVPLHLRHDLGRSKPDDPERRAVRELQRDRVGGAGRPVREPRPAACTLPHRCGALFAWTCTIRPSNLYLLPLIAIAYMLFTRSVSKVAWLASGMALLLLGSSALTWYQSGHFRLSGSTGYYLAFPLFSYHLFDAANGPQSRRVEHCDQGPAIQAWTTAR